MTKTFKKSLAVVVAIAMCLTAVVGALTVSATDGNTITVNSTTATEGATSSTVTISVVSTGFAAQLFTITYDTTLGTPTASINDASGAKLTVNSATAGTIVCLVENNSDNTVANVTAATITLVFTSTTGYPVGSYSVAVSNVSAADSDESLVTFNDPTNGTVTVAAAAPTLDSNITCTRFAGISDTISIMYVIPSSQLTNYSDFDLVITRNKCDASYNFVSDTKTINKSAATLASGNYYFVFTGIALYELNIPINAALHCKNAAGIEVAYSATFTDTATSLVSALYTSTTKTTLKTVITDMLNMGSEAQSYFVSLKPSSALASIALPNAGFDQTYASASVGTLNTVNNTVISSGTATLATMGTITSSPSIGYVISGATTYDASKLSLTVSYYNAYTTKTVTETATGSQMTLSGGKYYYIFSSAALYDGNKNITATLTYGGTTLLTNTYSVESFISANTSSTTMGTLLSDIAKFGASARAYFGIS